MSEEKILNILKEWDEKIKSIEPEMNPYKNENFKKILIYLLEGHYNIFADLLDLYYKQQRIMKSQEKIIMEQEKEIDKYKKQEFGNLFNGRYISKDKIRDKINTMNTNIVNAKRFDFDYIGNCRFAKYVLEELLEE